jgi:hypothetical protein
MRKLIILAISLVALAATTVPTLGVGLANAGTVSTAPDCKPVSAHTEYKWVPDQNGTGSTQWTLDPGAAGEHRLFNSVSYHRDGTKTRFIDSVTCAVSAPVFGLDANTCSVTVPYTPGINTILYGVNGPVQTPITGAVTVSGSRDGADYTAPQFWIGYTAQDGYLISNPGVSPTHFDFYNGDDVLDCGATGNVDWVYDPNGSTGNVTFTAHGTKASAKGELTYTDSKGDALNGVVTCFERIDAQTAVFSGTITGGNPFYLTSPNPYFIAKVVDNGAEGDQIAVYANHGDACSGDVFGTDLADVTSGDIVIH